MAERRDLIPGDSVSPAPELQPWRSQSGRVPSYQLKDSVLYPSIIRNSVEIIPRGPFDEALLSAKRRGEAAITLL